MSAPLRRTRYPFSHGGGIGWAEITRIGRRLEIHDCAGRLILRRFDGHDFEDSDLGRLLSIAVEAFVNGLIEGRRLTEEVKP
jgi:hypothetical protein